MTTREAFQASMYFSNACKMEAHNNEEGYCGKENDTRKSLSYYFCYLSKQDLHFLPGRQCFTLVV